MFKELLSNYGTELITSIIAGIISYIGIMCKNMYTKFIEDKIQENTVKNAVKAVEQLYKDKSGEEKKELAKGYALDVLNSKGVCIGDTELEVLIEASVQEFNKSKKVENKEV